MKTSSHQAKKRTHKAQPAVPEKTAVQRSAWIALLAVIALGVVLRIASLSGVTSRSPDERVYTAYARTIAARGLGATPALISDYDSRRENWVYPPPTRGGFVWLIAAAMSLSDRQDESVGAALSCLFSCLSLVLVAWIGWRFFNPWVALAAAVFLAVSLAELGMARRAWLDTLFGFLGLLLVYLACEISRNPRKLSLYAAFCAAGAYSLLTKESVVLSLGLPAVWVFGFLIWKYRSWKPPVLFVLGGVASMALTVLLWAVVAHGLGPSYSAIQHVLAAGRSQGHLDEYLVQCCSGPWYQFPYLLWLVGPVAALLALTGLIVTAWRKVPGLGAAGLCAFVVVVFVALASFGPGFQYLRIISPANGPYYLLAGLGLWYLLSLARRGLPASTYNAVLLLAVVAIAIGAARDYRTFRSVVVQAGIQDLSVNDIRTVLQR
jgi:4-amino-4-deoxy-L-arabinose transferase-like glycosyltransferase